MAQMMKLEREWRVERECQVIFYSEKQRENGIRYSNEKVESENIVKILGKRENKVRK